MSHALTVFCSIKKNILLLYYIIISWLFRTRDFYGSGIVSEANGYTKETNYMYCEIKT